MSKANELTLDEVVARFHSEVLAFKLDWLKHHHSVADTYGPENWPLKLPMADWYEHFIMYVSQSI